MNKNPQQKLPIVVICGRVNVGKSTLFNRLTEKSQALVSDIEGTTRDCNIGEVAWNRREFTLVDTAGLLTAKTLEKGKVSSNSIDDLAQKQALDYLKMAQTVIFLVDAKAGLLPEDKELAKAMNRRLDLKTKVKLVVNKVDGQKLRGESAQFNKLGLGEPLLISAQTGSGTGDLLDFIIQQLPQVLNKSGQDKEKEEDEELEKEEEVKLCIIGKPNVGKSSLLNALLGYERVIVSDQPHTTREPQDTEIIYQDQKIRLVDTAGVSRHGHKSKGLEKPGIAKSLGALQKSDIALLVIDISETLTHQDSKMVEEVMNRQKSLIFVANKWDLVETRDRKKWTQYIYQAMPFASWAPIVFISAKNKGKINTILDTALPIAQARKTVVSDTQLKKFLSRVVKIHLPAKGKGLKAPHIFEIKQARSNPPKFHIRIGSKDNLHFSYVRFLENRLREQFDFTGTPLKMVVTKNKRVHGSAN